MWPGEGFLSDAWSAAKSSFKGYYSSIANTVKSIPSQVKGLTHMSAGQLGKAYVHTMIKMAPINIVINNAKTMFQGATGLVQGDGKKFGGAVGNQVANTVAVGATALAGEGVAALRGVPISNPVPSTVARVVPIMETTPTTLGAPGAADVFVTGGKELQGLNAGQIAQKLTIPESPTGFQVFEFPTPEGISTPINRTNPGFIGGGRTAGGAPEFTVPNGPIPANATKTTIPPGS